MQAKKKEAEYRENQIGVDFTPCPADDCSWIKIKVFESMSLDKS
jgi:hypothetical protein